MVIDYNYVIDLSRLFLRYRNELMSSRFVRDDTSYYHNLSHTQLAAVCNVLGVEFWDLVNIVKSIMRFEDKNKMLRPLRFDAKRVVESVTYR